MIGRRVLALVLGVGLLAAAAGCGISDEPEATRIDPEQVPFALLEPEPSTTQATAGEPVEIFLISGDRLLAVPRTAPEDPTLADLLGLVVDGPSEQERALGVTSAVPAGTINAVETSRGSATVDLTTAFGELRPGDQVLALAQIVYVLTARPGIGSVAFTLDGEPIAVPRSDGQTSDDPLSRDDFEALAPR